MPFLVLVLVRFSQAADVGVQDEVDGQQACERVQDGEEELVFTGQGLQPPSCLAEGGGPRGPQEVHLGLQEAAARVQPPGQAQHGPRHQPASGA